MSFEAERLTLIEQAVGLGEDGISDSWRETVCELLADLAAVRAEVAASEAQNRALRTALEWYANTRNYDDDFTPGTLVGGGWAGTEPQDADWDPDYGERARKVLGLPDPWETDAAAPPAAIAQPPGDTRHGGADPEPHKNAASTLES